LSTQLARNNASLQSMNDERIKLLASACHDLRQPAHALGLLAELVVDQEDEQQRPARLEGIRRASETLANMLDMMLAVAQLEGGHETPTFSIVALDELMKEVELQFGAVAQRKGLYLKLPATGLSVRSDRNLLRRIFFNLVSNAVKYTRQGGVCIKVRRLGSQLELVVQDTGAGIAPQRQVDVFGYFVRLNITGESEGLGVGLPIVKRAAQLLGHPLQLRSKPDEGTMVSITMPLVGDAVDDAAGPEVAALGELSLQGDGRLVLLLEDDPESRQALAALLRRWGFVVFAASSMGVLMRQLHERPGALPDLIVSDQHMGVENGMEHIRALRARQGWGHVPAVLITGDLDPELADQAQHDDVVIAYKPLLPVRLKAVLAAVLAEHAS
jgi:CheY-like chemotaxis protein